MKLQRLFIDSDGAASILSVVLLAIAVGSAVGALFHVMS